MKAPRADAPGKGRGYVNLNDRRPQNLPACACYFSDVPVLVWNRPAGAENHALDRLITQISRLIDGKLFPQQLVGADHIWCHGLNVAISASARNSFCVVGTKAAVNRDQRIVDRRLSLFTYYQSLFNDGNFRVRESSYASASIRPTKSFLLVMPVT
jgi:hypothetical protein